MPDSLVVPCVTVSVPLLSAENLTSMPSSVTPPLSRTSAEISAWLSPEVPIWGVLVRTAIDATVGVSVSPPLLPLSVSVPPSSLTLSLPGAPARGVDPSSPPQAANIKASDNADARARNFPDIFYLQCSLQQKLFKSRIPGSRTANYVFYRYYRIDC